MNKSGLTIGITAFNEGDWLKQCWDSLVNQSESNWDAVIVLDGGSDRYTESIFNSICHNKLTKVRLNKNCGPYIARKIAIENTKSDWYFHLDGDDKLPLDSINKIQLAIEKYSYSDFVYGDAEYFIDGYKSEIRECNKLDFDKLLYTLPWVGTSPIKIELYKKIGGYSLDLIRGGADWDFWISAVENKAQGVRANGIIYQRRIRRGSVGSNRILGIESVAKKIIKRHPKFFNNQKKKHMFR